MTGELLASLQRLATLAREIAKREDALDDEIRRAADLGGSQREIAASAGKSQASVHRRLARALTPEDAAVLVERRAEEAALRLTLAKLSVAKKRLALGEEVDVEAEVGDIDELIAEALRAADGVVI